MVKRYEYRGCLYTIAELSNLGKISKKKLLRRIHKLGWDTERAMNTHASVYRKFYEYRGNACTITDLANVLPLQAQTVRMRLNAGWSVDRAAETPSRQLKPKSSPKKWKDRRKHENRN